MQENFIKTIEVKIYEQSQEQFLEKLRNSFLYDVEKIKQLELF